MNHEHYKEHIELLFYEELAGPAREEAEAHMLSCAECRSFFDELKKLHGVLAQYTPVEASDRLLSEARMGLHSALRDVRTQQSWWNRLTTFVTESTTQTYKVALGGVLMIAIGLFVGYFAFKLPTTPIVTQQEQHVQPAASQERPLLPEGGQISNVKFIDSDPRDGDVEFSFDAVMPMHMKGKVNDPQIQQVLSYALLNAQNPGTRLRSVNAMASESAVRPDDEVKRVLITALQSDDNPGVRKEALEALQKFPFDNEIKKTFMEALTHDSNSAIRIAAINALKAGSAKNIAFDQDLLSIFKEKMKSDNNPYVRIRAKTVLQEINQ